MSRQSTVGGVQATDLLEALGALGANATALSARVGLDRRDLEDPEARVPSSRIVRLLERAAWQLRDPLVGLHAGARVNTRGPLFYLLVSSARVGEGLRRLARFARVSLDTQEIKVSLGGGMVELTVDPGDPSIAQSRQASDYVMAAILSAFRRAVPGLRPLGVELMHERTGEGDQQEAERTLGCPVRFKRRRNVLRFPESMLRSAPAGANAAIAEQIERYSAALLARVTSDKVQDRVADVIRALLVEGVRPDRRIVARRMHTSERSLRRALLREATSLRRVRDRVLVETSRALLSNESLKVEAVGQSVGYADAASFSRAFTRWAGHSPARYRERLGKVGNLRDRRGRARNQHVHA